MGLPAGRWLRIERQFLPLLISTLLPILLLPSTANGDGKGRWILFTLFVLIIVQSLRSLPAVSPTPASELWMLIHRVVGGISAATMLPLIRFGEGLPFAVKGMLLPLGLFFVMTSVRLVMLLARVPRVNGQVMAGAAAGYLLLGLTGGVLATITETFSPGAFLLGTVTSHQMLLERLTYFSFVTLGSLGYGDVLPGNAFGERFAILLSVSGTLYVVLLVGLLLGRFIASEEMRLIEIEKDEEYREEKHESSRSQ